MRLSEEFHIHLICPIRWIWKLSRYNRLRLDHIELSHGSENLARNTTPMAKAPRMALSQHLTRVQQARMRHLKTEAMNRTFMQDNIKEAKRLQSKLLGGTTDVGAPPVSHQSVKPKM